MEHKKLGFGLMRLPVLDPADPASVDIGQLKQMVDLFINRGFTYFDTAIMYNGFASQRAIREALVERWPRDSFTLATKLHNAFIHTKEDRDRVFCEQLEQTGVDFFDYYLIHGIEGSSWPQYEHLDCFNWLLDKKKQGLIRHAGFSFHDTPEFLDHILTKYPEMEFVQLQINYLDWESEWIRSRAVYETTCKHNKPVIVMEPVKGGTLANVPAEAEKLLKTANPDMSVPSWAIRFAASLENVIMVLSGMSTLSQMEDNTGFMSDFQPLTDEEKHLTFRVAEIINAKTAIPCTGCSYCSEGCPKKIPIPKIFSLFNEDMREDLSRKGWTANYANYTNLTRRFGKASDCIFCAKCEQICPQHLPIRYLLKKKITGHFEHT